MQNIVSSKFAKKIVNVDSIEELGDLIKNDDMIIPADVRAFDREVNGEIYEEEELERARALMDGGKRPRVFRVDLEQSAPESEYPEEIKKLIEHITAKGLKSDGIFRRSPNKEMLNIVIQLIDTHQQINFDDYDISTLASVLKEFIRELPTTLIPEESYDLFNDPSIMTMEDEEFIPFVKNKFVQPLDERRKALLRDLMMLSAMTVQLSHINRMSSKSLAVVWAPNFVRMDAKADELKIINAVIRVVECMIVNYDQIFCNKY